MIRSDDLSNFDGSWRPWILDRSQSELDEVFVPTTDLALLISRRVNMGGHVTRQHLLVALAQPVSDPEKLPLRPKIITRTYVGGLGQGLRVPRTSRFVAQPLRFKGERMGIQQQMEFISENQYSQRKEDF